MVSAIINYKNKIEMETKRLDRQIRLLEASKALGKLTLDGEETLKEYKAIKQALTTPVVIESVCNCKIKEPVTFTEHGKIVVKCINCGKPIANEL